MSLLKGPREGLFLMSEVILYVASHPQPRSTNLVSPRALSHLKLTDVYRKGGTCQLEDSQGPGVSRRSLRGVALVPG